MRALLTGSGSREVWGRALTAEDPKLRAAGAEFLGKLGDDGSRSRLAGMLSDPSPTVRGGAVIAYGRLAERGGGTRLARHYEDETDFHVRLVILDAFRKNRTLRLGHKRR